MSKSYWTIKELEDMVTSRIVNVFNENKWVVIEFESGWRVKIPQF